MKQIFQNLRTGHTEVLDLPSPQAQTGQLLIRTSKSLLSAGTERMLVEFGKAGWIDRARQQPDKVRMVLDKIRTDGLVTTLEAVRAKVDEPLPMGYCNVGTVVSAGAGVEEWRPGDRVASNGRHAEVVTVPANLCARVPAAVSDDAAAFTVQGAIALQGIRLAQPTLGECFVVTGLGLIGLLSVQLLRAQGCRVLGIDMEPARLALARSFGAETVNLATEDWRSIALEFSRGRGVDGVLVTASTSSSEPIHQAAHMCRKRGRIVLVGVSGLQLSRADFFQKELTFQVSCSYGPGRYDTAYEDKGHDYPVGFVRWTEQRNFEAVLDMLAEGKLDVGPLISHRFGVEQAAEAYELVVSRSASLGILLEYASGAGAAALPEVVTLATPPSPRTGGEPPLAVSFIGAGNYASRTLMPAFSRAGARLHRVASASGTSAGLSARKHRFASASSDSDAVLHDRDANVVVVATRHDSHARFVCQALAAGKHVFVEKPLALTLQEIETIEQTYRRAHADGAAPVLMVGFNRRFAPQVVQMKALLDRVREPKCFIMTVNAGAVPPEHWVHDREAGGGRVVGEACHFIDLLRHLAGRPIHTVDVSVIGRSAAMQVLEDKVSIHLTFEDGSIGTVHYFANGHKAYPKETLEVFCGGRILQLDNFRKLQGWGWGGFSASRRWRQDKGQQACVDAFMAAAAGKGAHPIPLDELLEVSRVSIRAADLARQ